MCRCRYTLCAAFFSSVCLQEYVIKVHRGPNPEEGWEVSQYNLVL